jgi:membrane protein DedA with SNARE-associated domain
MDILGFIQAHNLHTLIYPLIFVLVVFDAAIVVFAAMFLLVEGIISPLPTLAVLMLGVLAEQLFWYWIGRKLGEKEKLMAWLDKPARAFDKHLLSRPFHTLVLSKFIYGIHRAMLVRAGMLKINFKIYLVIALICTILWLGVIGGIGYSFSASYGVLKEYIKYAELVPLGLIIIYFIIDWRISKRLKEKL